MLTNLIQKSAIYNLLRFLLTDNVNQKSFFVSVFEKLYVPYLTNFFLGLSVVASWYENLYLKYFSFSYLSLVLIVLAFLFSDKKRIIFRKVHLWYLIFLLISGLSALMAVLKGIDLMLLLSGLILLAQFFLIMITAQAVKKPVLFLKGLVWAALPLVLTGLFQFLTQQKTSSLWVSAAEKDITTRAFGFFGSPNILGILLSILVILCFGIYLIEKNKIYTIIGVFNLLILSFTFSRTAWLALAVSLIFGTYYFKKRMLILFPVLMILPAFIESFRNRIQTLFSQAYLFDSYLDGRLWAMINGLYIWKSHPILGTGPGTYGGQLAAASPSPIYLEGIQKGYTALYFTDNQFLEILVQTGILGLIAFMLFLLSFFVLIFKNLREGKDSLYLVAIMVLISFTVAGMFSNVLEFGAIVIPVAIIFGVAIIGKEKEDSSRLQRS